MFLKVSYSHQGCIYLTINKVKLKFCTILLQFKMTFFYFCDGKNKFSAAIISSVLSLIKVMFRNVTSCHHMNTLHFVVY